MNNSFININPFIGHRYKLKNTFFELIVGTDLGYCLGAVAKGKVTRSDGIKYTTVDNSSYHITNIDVRPRIQLSTQYKKFGLYTGYSLGVINYFHKFEIAPMFTHVIRFGITYKII